MNLLDAPALQALRRRGPPARSAASSSPTVSSTCCTPAICAISRPPARTATCSSSASIPTRRSARNKGPERPITSELERAEVLLALECVDAVSIFDEDTPAEIIRRVQPDVLVKGADWPADRIVGRDTVEARGGRVIRESSRAGLLDERAHRAGPRSNLTRQVAARFRVKIECCGRSSGAVTMSLLHLYVADASRAAQDGCRPAGAWSARPGRQRSHPCGEGAVCGGRRRPSDDAADRRRPTPRSNSSPRTRVSSTPRSKACPTWRLAQGAAVPVPRGRSLSRSGAALRRRLGSRPGAATRLSTGTARLSWRRRRRCCRD